MRKDRIVPLVWMDCIEPRGYRAAKMWDASRRKRKQLNLKEG
ncbi:MAG: hypothetical protein WBA22_10315 [Candidatus Methanofastidiosia archaeon]